VRRGEAKVLETAAVAAVMPAVGARAEAEGVAKVAVAKAMATVGAVGRSCRGQSSCNRSPRGLGARA